MDKHKEKAAWEKAIIKKTVAYMCKAPVAPATETSSLPDLANLPESSGDLSVICPKQAHFNQGMSVFGFTMADTRRINGGFGTFHKTVDIPENTRRITVRFTQDESQFHSITFNGKSSAHLGMTNEYVADNGLPEAAKVGRSELLILAANEELMGIELHHNSWCTTGITFVLLKL